MNFYKQDFNELTIKTEKHLLWVTLENPKTSNAISYNIIDSLTTALNFADQDPNVRVIILNGSGKTFCAGGDIKAMEEKSGMFAGEPNELKDLYQFGIQKIPLTIEKLKTPIIAMVNGPAIGAGCDLACMCDLRIGCEKTKFAETFSKLGLVPGDGGTFFLQRIIGYSKAMEMFLTGDTYSGKQAIEMDLLNYFVPSEKLEAFTEEIALKIASNSPIALSMTKKALKNSKFSDLQSHLDLLAAYQGIAQRTEDHFIGLKALKNKTKPQFIIK